MDFNKGFAGILFAAIIFVSLNIVSGVFFAPDELETPAYHVDLGVVQSASSDTGDTGPAYMTGAEFAALIDGADTAKGEKLFKKCAACHSNAQGGANKVGPALWGIFQKDIANVDGFSYSAALSDKDGNWDIENLNAWLYKPKLFAKGNKMSFAGLKKDADRAAMIAYLKSLQ